MVIAGVTIKLPEVEPTNVPPQLTVYHFHNAPSVPRLPPVVPKVEEEPEQIGEVEVAVVGAVEVVLTTTVTLAQVVVPQVPSALTQ